MRGIQYAAVAAIVLGILLGSFLVMTQASQTSGDRVDMTNQSIPQAVITQAPYPGYDYFVYYLKSNGSIVAISDESQTQVIQSLEGCKIPASQLDNMTAAIPCIFSSASALGQSVLNGTGYSNMSTIIQHGGAYYVTNTGTPTIELRVGWTDCSNPNYGNGTNACN